MADNCLGRKVDVLLKHSARNQPTSHPPCHSCDQFWITDLQKNKKRFAAKENRRQKVVSRGLYVGARGGGLDIQIWQKSH